MLHANAGRGWLFQVIAAEGAVDDSPEGEEEAALGGKLADYDKLAVVTETSVEPAAAAADVPTAATPAKPDKPPPTTPASGAYSVSVGRHQRRSAESICGVRAFVGSCRRGNDQRRPAARDPCRLRARFTLHPDARPCRGAPPSPSRAMALLIRLQTINTMSGAQSKFR